MKKLLFLFPIEEYMQLLWGHNLGIYESLNDVIEKRYRQKGYKIVFVTFKDKPIFGVNFCGDDKLIESDITFEEHTTPIAKDDGGKAIYRYTDNEHIRKLLGEFSELVVCGFHAQDCVMKVAEYFYNINRSTIVDEELTDFFNSLSERFYFNSEKYNLANKLLYDKSEDMMMYGREFITNFSHYSERYKKPYMHASDFVADFTLKECIKKIEQEEEIEKETRKKQ